MRVHKEKGIWKISLVFDSYALGSDGKTYYHIGREDDEGDLVTVGWSCEVDREMIIE